MHLGLRLLFGFFVITGLAGFFVLRVFIAEVKPAVQEVTEDILVDAAHLLAEQASAELAALPAGGLMQDGEFAAALRRYHARPVDAQIWGLHKRSLDFRLYITDASGRVVFDDGPGERVGADYSAWRDVARTLRGDYGARATRAQPDDPKTSVMYIAAPVMKDGKTIGVLTVAKPVQTLQQFIDRAEHKILVAGAWLLGLSLAVGVAVTLWTVGSVRRLRRYAQQARAGDEPQPVPSLPGELGDLARAMAAMRHRLDDRSHVEQSMRALTHELKSPLTAIGGAAELLHDELPPADRETFSRQIGEQVQRLRQLVEQLLELSKLESLRPPEPLPPVSPLQIFDELLREWSAPLRQRGLALRWGVRESARLPGDAERLRLALSNLLSNALDFAPSGSVLEPEVKAERGALHISLRDHGPGVPDFALAQLGQRFFSTPRPADGRKGSGLGLAIVRQVAVLHHGQLLFEPADPGLRVTLVLPR